MIIKGLINARVKRNTWGPCYERSTKIGLNDQKRWDDIVVEEGFSQIVFKRLNFVVILQKPSLINLSDWTKKRNFDQK